MRFYKKCTSAASENWIRSSEQNSAPKSRRTSLYSVKVIEMSMLTIDLFLILWSLPGLLRCCFLSVSNWKHVNRRNIFLWVAIWCHMCLIVLGKDGDEWLALEEAFGQPLNLTRLPAHSTGPTILSCFFSDLLLWPLRIMRKLPSRVRWIRLDWKGSSDPSSDVKSDANRGYSFCSYPNLEM